MYNWNEKSFCKAQTVLALWCTGKITGISHRQSIFVFTIIIVESLIVLLSLLSTSLARSSTMAMLLQWFCAFCMKYWGDPFFISIASCSSYNCPSHHDGRLQWFRDFFMNIWKTEENLYSFQLPPVPSTIVLVIIMVDHSDSVISLWTI